MGDVIVKWVYLRIMREEMFRQLPARQKEGNIGIFVFGSWLYEQMKPVVECDDI